LIMMYVRSVSKRPAKTRIALARVARVATAPDARGETTPVATTARFDDSATTAADEDDAPRDGAAARDVARAAARGADAATRAGARTRAAEEATEKDIVMRRACGGGSGASGDG